MPARSCLVAGTGPSCRMPGGSHADHAREDGVDERESRCRTVAHRHRHCTVQLDHGRRIEAQDIASPTISSQSMASAWGASAYRGNRRLSV